MTEKNKEPSTLTPKTVNVFFIATLIGSFVYFFFSNEGLIGLSGARDSWKWSLMRYVVVTFWCTTAYLIYRAKEKKAYTDSLVLALNTSGITVFILAAIWASIGSPSSAIFFSAIIYCLLAVLNVMTIRSSGGAAFLGFLLIFVQIGVDVFVLGSAGNFRIH